MTRVGLVAANLQCARSLREDLGLGSVALISSAPYAGRGLTLDTVIIDETRAPASTALYEDVLPTVAAGGGTVYRLRRLDDRMTFGDALDRLKAGDRVCRRGWNGAGQFLELQRADARSKMTVPYIYITTVQGDRVPWFASQTDMLADDWRLA